MFFTGHQLISQVVRTPLTARWTFKSMKSDTWRAATVPGCVHTDLLACGVIADPFFRLNERDVQWIDKEDWIYKGVFAVDSGLLSRGHVELNFKGLDTYAKVYLNGVLILEADNMFREWVVECKKLLKQTGNELLVEFKSPINAVMPAYDTMTYHYPSPNDQSQLGGLGDKKVGMLTRKAGYHYGWDWGPRLVTSGIWRPIIIEAHDSVRLRDVYVLTRSASSDIARLDATVELAADETGRVEVELFLDDKLVKEEAIDLQAGITSKLLTFTVKNPSLWWSNGLGKPYLYAFKTVVKKGNKVVDEHSTRVGIRTVELVHQRDSLGRTFYFKLNGIPVFMKGANFIPIDNFPSRVADSRYAEVIRSATEANMNMLRVWGGGIYENDVFYKLCDENGILVWQDFMFACALYPAHDAFLENVRREATDNVRRLRNHPCIALWCGNNEIHTAWHSWGWKPDFEKQSPRLAEKLWDDYDTLFHKLLAKVVIDNDGQRFYWPSSPMASLGEKAGDLNSGDIHYWDVWHFAKPFEEYSSNVGRFMSEYGFQSFPAISSVKRYTQPSDHSIDSEVMMSHQRHPRGNELIKTYLGYYYRKPKDFESFLYVGQVLQAEGIKLAVESHRSNMPRCMGSLYWQINDCWPVASWSSTDYYGKWKALHYFMKKAFNPLLIVANLNEKSIDLSLVSDKQEDVATTISCDIVDLSGKLLWTKQVTVKFVANSSTPFSIDYTNLSLSSTEKRSCVVIIKPISMAEGLEPCVAYFNKPNAMNYPRPNIRTSIKGSPSEYSVSLSTDKLAKNVHVEIPGDGFLSDNYFDMMPGETKTITIKSAGTTITSDDIKVKTIVDTY